MRKIYLTLPIWNVFYMSEISKESEPNGYSYYVSDEQLAAFAKLTMLERLQWVEEARMFTLMTQTPETKARHESLRKGNNQKATFK